MIEIAINKILHINLCNVGKRKSLFKQYFLILELSSWSWVLNK